VELESPPHEAEALLRAFPKAHANLAPARLGKVSKLSLEVEEISSGALEVAATLRELGLLPCSLVARRANLADAYASLTGRSLEP
jgi:hypothetical protein